MSCQCCELVPHPLGGGGGATGEGWPPDDQSEWRYVGQVTEPAFNTGYSNTGVENNTRASFRREGGKVFLAGVVTADVETIGSNPVFTLPVGYRPSERQTLVAFTNGDPVLTFLGWVEADGDVFLVTNEIDVTMEWVPSLSWFWIDAPEIF